MVFHHLQWKVEIPIFGFSIKPRHVRIHPIVVQKDILISLKAFSSAGVCVLNSVCNNLIHWFMTFVTDPDITFIFIPLGICLI